MKKITRQAKFALAITLTLWASAFVGIRAGLQGYSPGPLALLRFIAASVCMVIIYFALPHRKKLNIRDVTMMLFLGALSVGGYHLALNYGELSVPAAPASFIVSQSPVITAILAMMFLGERLNWQGVLGMVISVLGVSVILFGHLDEVSWGIGNLYVGTAAFLGAIYSIVQKHYLEKYTVIEVTSFFMWGGALSLILYFPELIHELPNASVAETSWAIYLGIFPAAVAAMSWSYILANMPASRAINFLYFMPLLTAVLGWLLLQEIPGIYSLLGGMIALVGVWVLNESYKKLPLEMATTEK